MREIVVSVILYSLAHLYDDCVACQPMGTKIPFQKGMHGGSIASLQRTINPSSSGVRTLPHHRTGKRPSSVVQVRTPVSPKAGRGIRSPSACPQIDLTDGLGRSPLTVSAESSRIQPWLIPRKIFLPSLNFSVWSVRKSLLRLKTGGSATMLSILEFGMLRATMGEKMLCRPRTIWRSMT